MDKIELLKQMKTLLTQERKTDRYVDGVLDMYNAALKLVEEETFVPAGEGDCG